MVQGVEEADTCTHKGPIRHRHLARLPLHIHLAEGSADEYSRCHILVSVILLLLTGVTVVTVTAITVLFAFVISIDTRAIQR